jgi:4,5-dihydroxyphthalate decarboxylase
MLRNREFDCAELSMSNYLMAKYTGLPFIAIPVFLHRRFRHGFVFLNANKGITKPSDLIGRKVGLRNFQATANLWIRGIWNTSTICRIEACIGFKQDDEEVDWTPPADLKHPTNRGRESVDRMLVDGDIDALIHPELIQPILDKDPRLRVCFPTIAELEMDYFKRTGIFPNHAYDCIKQEIVDKYPWMPINLYQALEASKKGCL